MKENKLSVWTFSYRKSYYLTHPWLWFKDLYWNIRNFWHRGRYGYAYVDVWNFCDWYPRAGAAALRYLADHGHGYPGHVPWETPEKWHDHLHELANQLDRCADSLDICFGGEERNEYAEEFHRMCDELQEIRKNEDGTVTMRIRETPEYKELRDNYFRRVKEIDEADNRYREEIYKFVGANLGRYWD